MNPITTLLNLVSQQCLSIFNMSLYISTHINEKNVYYLINTSAIKEIFYIS